MRLHLSARFRCLGIQDRLDRRGVQLRREPVEGEKRGRNLRDLGGRRHRCTPDSGPSCREDACDRVLAREVRRASSEEALVARLAPALARRVDVDSLVARNEHELRRPVEVEAPVELLLPPDVEGGLARLRMGNLGQPFGKLVRQPAVLFRPGYLAEVDLTAVAEAIGMGCTEVDLCERRLLVCESVLQLGCVRGSSRSRSGQLRPAEAEVAGVLEPPIDTEEPVGRLHADRRGRRPSAARPRAIPPAR